MSQVTSLPKVLSDIGAGDLREDSFTAVWLRTPDRAPLEVSFDLQGDVVFLVPGVDYLFAAPGLRASDKDVIFKWSAPTSLLIIGSSPAGPMYLIREDGTLVWSDSGVWGHGARPPQLKEQHWYPRALRAIDWLARHTSSEGSGPVTIEDFEQKLSTKASADGRAGRQSLYELAERSLVGLAEDGTVSLSPAGQRLLRENAA
ncbi:MAG: hypothetical protein QOF51_73 [Chloroflexota bacterium]|jgi:hypothetical protein|nr:hypothetical protein [Chloroflexota bacterium]